MTSNPDVVAALRFSQFYLINHCYLLYKLTFRPTQHIREFPVGTLFSW